MPHQCVRCGKLHEKLDVAKGCDCGAKLFFFLKNEHIKDLSKTPFYLSTSEKKQMEKDVYELLGMEHEKDKPVVLDFESIRVLKPGKYELDLVKLFQNDPLVYRMEEGKYMIDLPESLRRVTKRKAA